MLTCWAIKSATSQLLTAPRRLTSPHKSCRQDVTKSWGKAGSKSPGPWYVAFPSGGRAVMFGAAAQETDKFNMGVHRPRYPPHKEERLGNSIQTRLARVNDS